MCPPFPSWLGRPAAAGQSPLAKRAGCGASSRPRRLPPRARSRSWEPRRPAGSADCRGLRASPWTSPACPSCCRAGVPPGWPRSARKGRIPNPRCGRTPALLFIRGQRRLPERRLSNFLLWQSAYAELVFRGERTSSARRLWRRSRSSAPASGVLWAQAGGPCSRGGEVTDRGLVDACARIDQTAIGVVIILGAVITLTHIGGCSQLTRTTLGR
jgi:hypothetical protein